MPRTQRPVINFAADDVWAASARAQRINGGYVKFINPELRGADAVPTTTNRELVEKFLANPSELTDQDRTEGETIRTYYKGLTFKILQGIKLGEFDNTAMTIANRDTITNSLEIGVITSLPSCYERGVKRDTLNRRIDTALGGYIGRINEKVKLSNLEVLRTVYSQSWNTYYVTAVTDKDEVLFFSYRQGIDAGKKINVQGTVKSHRDNKTQLNRVKVI